MVPSTVFPATSVVGSAASRGWQIPTREEIMVLGWSCDWPGQPRFQPNSSNLPRPTSRVQAAQNHQRSSADQPNQKNGTHSFVWVSTHALFYSVPLMEVSIFTSARPPSPESCQVATNWASWPAMLKVYTPGIVTKAALADSFNDNFPWGGRQGT